MFAALGIAFDQGRMAWSRHAAHGASSAFFFHIYPQILMGSGVMALDSRRATRCFRCPLLCVHSRHFLVDRPQICSSTDHVSGKISFRSYHIIRHWLPETQITMRSG